MRPLVGVKEGRLRRPFTAPPAPMRARLLVSPDPPIEVLLQLLDLGAGSGEGNTQAASRGTL